MKCMKIRACVLIALVLILPVYIADAYAGGLSVIRSSGAANVDNFFDGAGDNWIVQVRADLDGRAVSPSYVTLMLPTGAQKFLSCQESTGPLAVKGEHICTWESGEMSAFEGRYDVSVELKDPAGPVYTDDTYLIIDSSAPKIVELSAVQKNSMVRIHYKVTDSVKVNGVETSSGLDKIEFYDGGNLLGEVELDGIEAEGDELVSLPKEGTFDEQNIIVKAYDVLGHVAVVSSDNFELDLSIPQIDADSFLIGRLKEYAPAQPKRFDISVNISEDKGLVEVVGDFTNLGLGSAEIADRCDKVGVGVFRCVWLDRLVAISWAADVTISAKDVSGNIGRKTISRTFIVDADAPVIEFVGTNAYYSKSGKSYVRRNRVNTFKVQLRDYDSGISAENVLLDLHAINPDLSEPVPADVCVQDAAEPGLYSCYWNATVKNTGTIILTAAEDNAGNNAALAELTKKGRVAVFEDIGMPVIESVSIVALGVEFGEREYFQSDDYITITAEVSDEIAVMGYADLRNVINRPGLELVEADRCEFFEDKWVCVWEGKGPLKSGYVKSAIRFVFEDMVGNQASELMAIEILERAGDVEADYWNIGEIENRPAAIDRQTTNLINQRMYFEIPIHATGYRDVEALAVELDRCELAEGDTSACSGDCLHDSYMINKGIKTTKPYVVLELETFEGNITHLTYSCTLRIFSRVGKKATGPEMEIVNLTVPFYNLPIGVIEQNLAEKIKREKHKVKTGFFGAIDTLNDVVKWSRLLCDTLQTLDILRQAWAIINKGFDSLRATVYGAPIAILKCGAIDQIEKRGFYTFGVKFLDKFCKLATCRHDYGKEVWGNFYKNYMRYAGYRPLKVAPDPNDNLVVATATMCVPSMIYNLDKLRQIRCRYIACLENDVPRGIATVETCRELLNYQECKYVWGNLFQLLPFVGTLNQILKIVKSMLTDPVGIFRMGVIWGCAAAFCSNSNTMKEVCDYAGAIIFLMDMYEDFAALGRRYKTIKRDYCKEIGI